LRPAIRGAILIRMRYSWILFDADGVLFDYDSAERQALHDAWELTGREYGADALATYKRVNKELWGRFERGALDQDRLKVLRFEMLLQELGAKADPGAMSDRYLESLGNNGGLLPGAREVLETLQGRVGMAMITNGIAKVQRGRLAQSGIRKYFSSIIISAEVGAAKPDPRIFDHAFESIGRPDKSEVLMVGDSLSSDIMGGVGYGLDTCWINPSGAAPTEGLDVIQSGISSRTAKKCGTGNAGWRPRRHRNYDVRCVSDVLDILSQVRDS